MNTPLLLVVVVVSASTYTSAHYSSHSGPGVKRWPFYIAPSSDQPSGHQPSGQQPSGHQPYGHQPYGHQPYGHQSRAHWRNHQVSVPGRPLVTQGNRNYPYGPSYGVSSIDAFNHRVTDVRKRCRNDDLLLLRRLLEQGKHTYGIRKPHFPRFPSFGIPRYIPNLGDSSEEEQRSNSDEGSYEFDLDDYFYDSDEDTDDGTTFLDFPVQKPGWSIHPFFPKVPTADDFPDDYDNATHTVHVLNGTRVEVNTTTNKDTDDSITTFFHTKVINIGPHTPTKGKVPEKEDAPERTPERTPTPDEGLAGEPVVPVYEVEETTTKQIPVVEETTPEIPVYDHKVLSELVLEEEPGSDTRVVRDSPSRPGKQPSASYVKKHVKGASKGGSKGGKARPKPRDLSRDTLVNHINKDSEEDKPTEPDAEVIF